MKKDDVIKETAERGAQPIKEVQMSIGVNDAALIEVVVRIADEKCNVSIDEARQVLIEELSINTKN